MKNDTMEKRPLLDAINSITESKKKNAGVLRDARTAIVEYVKSVGGAVAFSVPEYLRGPNEAAIEKAVSEATDDESRAFFRAWKGPKYGDALRMHSQGFEWMSADGPVFGYIERVRVEGDTVAVEVVPEDDILSHGLCTPVTVTLAETEDAMAVLQFLIDFPS